MSIAIRVGGHWHSPPTHTPPVYGTVADGGMGDASFTLNLSPEAAPLGLRRDAEVEIFEDTQRVYLGRVNGIDPETWGVTCRGIQTDLDGVPALTGSGTLARDITTALATAAASPFNVTIRNDRGITGTALGDDSEPVMVGHLLELIAEQEAGRWGVDADRQLYLADDPIVPQWMVVPRPLTLSDEGGAAYNMYAGRHITLSGAFSTAYSPTPTDAQPRCANLDLTQGVHKRGRMTAFDATVVLTKLAEATKAAVTWGSALSVVPGQIMTMGGHPAPASRVLGGQMIRLFGLTASQQAAVGAQHLDVVMKSVTRDTADDSLTLEPVGALPLTVEAAFASIP